jgi:predicted amidohydrolase
MAFRIAVAQMNSQTGYVAANRDKAVRLIEGAASLGAQIVLVPETFTTGYDIADRLDTLAEPIPGTTTGILGEVAKSRRVYIYASMVEKAGGKYHNTGVLIDPSGKLVHAYRKVHLFATEKRMFTPGDRPAVIKTDLGTFGLTICMDLLFPEYTRGLVLSGAEYILNSTDWLRWGPLDAWSRTPWGSPWPANGAKTATTPSSATPASSAPPAACSPEWRKARGSRCTNSAWRRSATGARSARTSPTAATISTFTGGCQTPSRR